MAFAGVLPEAPSFGTQLARGLGGGFSQGVNKAGDVLAKSALEKQKSNSLLSTISRLKGGGEGLDINNLTPEQQGILATQYPEFVTAYQAAQKTQAPQKEKERKAEGVLNISKKMRDMIGYTGSQWAPGPGFDPTKILNRKAIQVRSEFDSLAASYASYFRDLETKGQLPLGLYEEVIKPRLPNSKLNERENLGRIDGMEELAREFGGLNAKQSDLKSSKNSKEVGIKGKIKFSQDNPEHRKKAEQLYKTYKNKEKVREILSREFEI